MKSWRFIVPTIALLVAMTLPRAATYAAIPAPASPTNVMAWAGNGSARVTWESPVIAMVYKLSQYQINIYQDGILVGNMQVPAPASEKVISGLINYRTYTFTVQLKQMIVGDAAEESAWSTASRFSNPVVPPGGSLPTAPPKLDAHATDSAALITWMAPASAGQLTTYQVTAYNVGISGMVAVQRIRIASTFPTATWVTNLQNGQSYRFTVQAANTAGWGPESVLTDPVISPSSIGLASPTMTSIASGNGSVTLNWSAPYTYSIDHYLVLVTRDDGTLVTYRDGMLPPVTIDGLTNGAAYNFEVRAVTTGHLMSAPARSRVVLPVAIQPPLPANLRATLNDKAVALYWDAPVANPQAPIDHYAVSVFLNTTQVWTNDNVHVTSVGVPGLLAGWTYTAEVRSVSTANVKSDPATVRFTAATIPSSPTNVRATYSGGQVIVTWTGAAYDGASAITRYEVRGSYGPAKESSAITAGPNQTSVIFSNLTLGQTYTFTVQAFNAVGGSPLSAPSNAVTIATVPTIPRNLSVTAGDESATLKWDAPASDGGKPIQGYQVTASDGVHAPITSFVTGTSATLTGLTNGVTYTISVTAKNEMGLGNPASGEARPVNLPPTLTIPGNQTVQYSDPLPLVVTATGPEASDHIVLSAAGLPAGLTFTDKGTGTGEISGAVQAAPGTYPVTISVNDGHNPVAAQSFTITVTREDAVITPANPAALTVKKVTDTKTVTIQATIRESDTSVGNLANTAPVTIALKPMGSGTSIIRTATLTGSGTSMTAAATFRNLPINVYRITVSVGGNHYQGQAASLMTIASSAQRGSVQGTGDVSSERTPGAVELTATIRKNGTVTGSLTYSGHHSEGDFVLNGKLVGGLVIKNHRAYFQGRGTMNGVAGYRFAVAVVDNRHLETDGQIAIWTVDPLHQVIGHCTFTLTPVGAGEMAVFAK